MKTVEKRDGKWREIMRRKQPQHHGSAGGKGRKAKEPLEDTAKTKAKATAQEPPAPSAVEYIGEAPSGEITEAGKYGACE